MSDSGLNGINFLKAACEIHGCIKLHKSSIILKNKIEEILLFKPYFAKLQLKTSKITLAMLKKH